MSDDIELGIISSLVVTTLAGVERLPFGPNLDSNSFEHESVASPSVAVAANYGRSM